MPSSSASQLRSSRLEPELPRQRARKLLVGVRHRACVHRHVGAPAAIGERRALRGRQCARVAHRHHQVRRASPDRRAIFPRATRHTRVPRPGRTAPAGRRAAAPVRAIRASLTGGCTCAPWLATAAWHRAVRPSRGAASRRLRGPRPRSPAQSPRSDRARPSPRRPDGRASAGNRTPGPSLFQPKPAHSAAQALTWSMKRRLTSPAVAAPSRSDSFSARISPTRLATAVVNATRHASSPRACARRSAPSVRKVRNSERKAKYCAPGGSSNRAARIVLSEFWATRQMMNAAAEAISCGDFGVSALNQWLLIRITPCRCRTRIRRARPRRSRAADSRSP